MRAVAALVEGRDREEVAAVFQTSLKAVDKWWSKWLAGGREALVAHHQPPGPQTGFVSGEPARDPAHGHLERLPPRDGIYAATCGHRLIVTRHKSR